MRKWVGAKSYLVRLLCLVAIPCIGLLALSSNGAAQTTSTAPIRTLLRAPILDCAASQAPSHPSELGANTITVHAVTDSDVTEAYPTSNCGSEVVMRVGYDDYLEPDGKIIRGLIKFPLTAIPQVATVTNASLQVFLVESWDFEGATRVITAYRVTQPWVEDIVGWGNAPSFGEAYGQAAVHHDAAEQGAWYSLDVTALVSAWHSGLHANYGLMLRDPEWSGYDSSWKGFATAETVLFSPRLVIDYDVAAPTATPTYTPTITTTATPTHTPTITTTPQATEPSPDYVAYLPILLKQSACVTTEASPTPVGPQEMVALVVGIADYENMSSSLASSPTRAGAPGSDILFSVRDAHKMHDRLTHRPSHSGVDYLLAAAQGYGTQNMMLLLDQQATKAGIRDAILGWLDPLEDESTQVLFFFSGHGMYAPDDNPPEEADGLDEFIVPFDIECLHCGTPQVIWLPETAVRDDELDQWLNELESQHITVIIDSCFSGGMVGTGGYAVKGLSWTPELQSGKVPVVVGDGFAQDIDGDGRVILMASREDQGSWEFGELAHGVFTYYLLEALRTPVADTNVNGYVSAEEAYAYLRDRVDNWVFDKTGEHQNPQLFDTLPGQADLTQPVIVAPCPW